MAHVLMRQPAQLRINHREQVIQRDLLPQLQSISSWLTSLGEGVFIWLIAESQTARQLRIVTVARPFHLLKLTHGPF